MRAAVVESRPLVGLGIQRVLHRITDIDASRVISPELEASATLQQADLLIVGELSQGYTQAIRHLLGTAASVRCVLYLNSGGDVQWMPPREVSPLMAWLPEHASPEVIESTIRTLIGSIHYNEHAGAAHHDSESFASATVSPDDHALDALFEVAFDAVRHSIGPRSRSLAARVPRWLIEAQLLRLTQRQYDVLVLLSKGLSIKLIGRRLRIAVPTVKSHTLQIYRRLSANSKTEAVFMAREKGAMLANISSRDFTVVDAAA